MSGEFHNDDSRALYPRAGCRDPRPQLRRTDDAA